MPVHTSPETWLAIAHVFRAHVVMEGLRYAAVAAVLWLLLHVLLRRWLAHRVIAGWPQAADLRREIGYSVASVLVFAGLGVGITALLMNGQITVYRRPDQFGWAWLLLSLPALLVWHDFYFYVTHRLLHTPWLFRRVHGVHHRSRNPSPFAAYAFHPVEALVNGLVTPLALLAVPVHGVVLLVFALHQIVRNAHGHLSVETMPRGFARHGFWGRFTTTTHHHLHHETARGNYGLWFTWWDRAFGTERSEYLARFDAATGPRPARDPSAAGGPTAA